MLLMVVLKKCKCVINGCIVCKLEIIIILII